MELRSLTDIPAYRKAMFRSAKEGVADNFPLENEKYRIDLGDLKYTGNPPSRSDEREAILKDGSLTMPLRGKLKLIDKETNEVVEEKNKLMARVPYVTDQGTVLFNGSDYAISNQMRLKPGIYTRIASNGKIEAPVQTKNKGGFKITLEPETGDMSIRVQQSKLNLYELMRAMGTSDAELKSLWGEQVFKENKTSADPRAMSRIAEKVTGSTDTENLGDKIRGFFNERKVDPKLAELSTGIKKDHVTKDMLKSISRKLIDISSGKAKPDSRDTLYSQRLFTGPRNLKYYMKQHTQPISKALWKVTGKGTLDRMPAGVFNESIKRLLYKSGLSQPMEEVSPLETRDLLSRIVRTGEHGLSKKGIPFEARMVHPSQMGFIGPVRTSESTSVGVDTRAAANLKVDDEGNMYTEVENAQTGDQETISAADLSDVTLALPDQKGKKSQFAVVNGSEYKRVPPDEVDYYLPQHDAMLSNSGRLLPMSGGSGHLRILMGGKFANQAVPLRNNESPLVQAAPSEEAESYERKLADWAGAERAPVSGTVTDIGKQSLTLKKQDGSTVKVPMYENRALNRKTQLHQEPIVEVGDTVEEGQTIVKSNFTNDRGTMALGTNLRVGFIPSWRTFEDTMAISESAADKLTSEHMYQKDLQNTEGMTTGKSEFINMFPGKYTKEQLDKLDDRGIVKPGVEVEEGDPLILGYRRNPNKAYYYQLRKSAPAHRNETVTWDKSSKGKVTDAAKTKEGQRVFVQTDKNMHKGDKIAARYGAKGIVNIVPDEEMPRDKNGDPLELVISPLAIISRQNPSLFLEAMLGKVAKKLGKPIKTKAFPIDNEGRLGNFVKETLGKLRQNDINPMEELYDPHHDKDIGEVLTGNLYVYKLAQMSEEKSRSRGRGGYSSLGIPTTGGTSGAKKIGRQPMAALMSHGALDLIGDALKVRGDKNTNFWKAMKLGRDPAIPGIPESHKVLFDLVKGGGINIKREGDRLHTMPLTDEDIERMSHGEIKNSQMLRRDNLKPRPGGLFDPKVTSGPGGSNWSHVSLPEAIPNPAMEKSIASLLGLTQKGLERVLTGKQQLHGDDGPSAIQNALGRIDVENERSRISNQLGQMSKTKRDKAVKRLKYLNMMNEYDINPSDLMISKVPVIPPRARPVADVPTMDNAVISDPNYLYKDLIDLVNEYNKDKDELPEDVLEAAEGDIYKATKAVFGLGDPVSTASKQKNLKGVLGQVFGDSTKDSYIQSKIMSRPVDLSGLAVIEPNVNLNMDQVGLPKGQAWEIYEPLIVRQLVKDGHKPTAAIKSVENQDKTAERALKKVVDSRPILVNRAPTLHKHSLMAMWPRLVDGESLEISPQVVEPYGADYDGDSGRFIVVIEISLTGATQLDYNRRVVKWNSFKGRKISMPISKDGEVASARGPVGIDDLPIIEDSREEKEDGTVVYDVPDGVKVVSLDTETGKHHWMPVTKLSIHPNLQMRNVTVGTRSTSTINVSKDDSLIVYDDGEIKPAYPDEVEGLMVPQMKGTDVGTDTHMELSGEYFSHIESMEAPLSEDVGFFLGLMAGNGWVDTSPQTFVSNSHPAVFERVKNITDLPHNAKDTAYKRVNINGDLKEAGRIQVGLPAWLSRALSQWFGHGAEEKRLPSECFFGSKEHLMGILDGLWSSDGSISINRSKSKPQLQVNYSTTSPYLKDQIIYLCRLLGINATSTDATNSVGTEYYMISLSSVDVKTLVEKDGWSVTPEDKQKKLEEGLQYVNPKSKSAASMDSVPYPRHLHQYFLDINRTEGLVNKSGPSTKKKKGYVSREWMERFLPHLKQIDNEQVQEYCNLVENKQVTWKPVKSVKESGETTAYDITVPGTWTFANAEGIFMQDTMMFHVPVTDKGIEDAKEMVPSKNLTSMRDDEPVYVPMREFGQGIYLASQKGEGQPVAVDSKEEAMKLYKQGKIKADTPIVIK